MRWMSVERLVPAAESGVGVRLGRPNGGSTGARRISSASPGPHTYSTLLVEWD